MIHISTSSNMNMFENVALVLFCRRNRQKRPVLFLWEHLKLTTRGRQKQKNDLKVDTLWADLSDQLYKHCHLFFFFTQWLRNSAPDYDFNISVFSAFILHQCLKIWSITDNDIKTILFPIGWFPSRVYPVSTSCMSRAMQSYSWLHVFAFHTWRDLHIVGLCALLSLKGSSNNTNWFMNSLSFIAFL